MLEYQRGGLAEHADNIAGSFEEEGLPVPDEFAGDRPVIKPQFLFYFTALRDLATERPARGMRIPVTAQMEYAEKLGVSRIDEFLDILARVDSWLLNPEQGTDEDGRPRNTGDSGPGEHPTGSQPNYWLNAEGEA